MFLDHTFLYRNYPVAAFWERLGAYIYILPCGAFCERYLKEHNEEGVLGAGC